jgi:hypothetical protein
MVFLGLSQLGPTLAYQTTPFWSGRIGTILMARLGDLFGFLGLISVS